MSAPNGLWFDASGALYIADSSNAARGPIRRPSAFSNFAGNRVAGFKGDGGPATSAQLNKPVGITMDAAGNIYVADANNSRIRKILADGTITTIAGKGGAAYSGDGGSATAASLSFPRSIAVSSNGKVYIADTGNHVIRTLTPSISRDQHQRRDECRELRARASRPARWPASSGPGSAPPLSWPTTASIGPPPDQLASA